VGRRSGPVRPDGPEEMHPVKIIALAAIAAAGCGGSNESTQTSAPSGTTTTAGSEAVRGTTLEVAADAGGQLRFDKKLLATNAGPVTIIMDNPSPLPHNISLEGNGVDKRGPTVGNAGTSKITVDLKPGRYTYYCSVPGHRAGGMVGTLIIK
jgi:plastocyanin